MAKQILVSMDTVAKGVDNDEGHTYHSLLQRGESQGQHKITEAQREVQFDDPIVALFTSGSTGEPKVVQNTTHGIVNFFGQSIRHMGSSKQPWDTLYNDRPFSWGLGYLFSQIGLFTNITPIIVPTELALFEERSLEVFKIWEREQCVTCLLSATLFQKLYTDRLHLKFNFSQIKLFVVGGQRYPLDMMQKLFDMFPGVKVSKWRRPVLNGDAQLEVY